MCGIIAYSGEREAYDILYTGLERLEYRGYDSAGIVMPDKNRLQINKVVGRVENLKNKQFEGLIGIGHTRWATHGKVTQENAHPHTDCTGKIAVAHNGIIENFLKLKIKLQQSHNFKSFTDSEVIAHLIEEEFNVNGSLHDAVIKVLPKLHGTYALCVMHNDRDEIVAARNGGPMTIGIGENENFAASDVSAFVEHTKKAVYLDDLETAVIKRNSVKIFDKNKNEVQKPIKIINWNLEQAQKHGYKHFMLKEVMEQADVIKNSLNIEISSWLLKNKEGIKEGVNERIKKIFISACGTAGYAGLVGKYIIEKTARIPVEFESASEFRYRNPIITKDDLLIVISQSGETADTLAALRLAKEKWAKVLGIINVVDSTIAREADDVVYTRAGPEIGVASTKAFLSQLIVLYKIAEKLSGKKFDMEKIPKYAEEILKNDYKIRDIAKKYFKVYNFIYIGRNINYPIALEGALKLKEISYIHAEGYSGGEMKHGPIALVTDEVPTVAIAVKDDVYPKMISNMQEIAARNGKIIAIATEGDEEIKRHCNDVLYIPKVEDIFYPVLAVIPLQLFAYYIADFRECDIDKPRNLAKSVTVE